jgi:hypothetical protein
VGGGEGEIRGADEGKELEREPPPEDDGRGRRKGERVGEDVLSVREPVAGGRDDHERRKE